jgi:hypothetical protein
VSTALSDVVGGYVQAMQLTHKLETAMVSTLDQSSENLVSSLLISN